MKYIYNSDSLSHAKTDWSWDQHKYKSKEWVNGAWKYIYNTAKNTKNKAANAVQNVSNVASNTAKAISTTAAKTVSNASNAVKDTAKNVVDKAENKINAEKATIKQAKEDAKKAVESNQKAKALPAAAIIGIAFLGLIATRLIATAALYVYASNEAAKEAKESNKDNAMQRRNAKADTRVTKAQNASEDEKLAIMESINPKYDPTKNDGWANNCYSCSLAYDMSRRGIDTKAINDFDGESFSNIENCYIDAKRVDVAPEHPQLGFSKEEAKKFLNDMENDYPDGAYGNFMVTWTPPYGLLGGHSVVWEKVDGQIIIRDCQTNKVYSSDEEIYSNILTNTGSTYYFRTDNLEINNTHMAKYTDQSDNGFKVADNTITWDNVKTTDWDGINTHGKKG